MTFDELLNWFIISTSDCISRIQTAVGNLSEADFNKSAIPGLWSPALIVEHLVLSNAPYIEMIEGAVAAAEPLDGSTEMKQTFLGAQIRKAAGPSGNAPVPRAFAPKASEVPKSQIGVLSAQVEMLAAMAERARGKDLNAKLLRNPLLKLFRMNLADCFAIISDHMERHTKQIEERAVRA